MYGLYKFDNRLSATSIEIEKDYFLYKFKPSLFSLSATGEKLNCKTRLSRLYFLLISFGKFEIYFINDSENNVVHSSYVIGKCYKFKFLKKNDFEIGPCYTHEKHRGKKLYPYTLQKITVDKSDGSNDFYMIIHDSNQASINGVKKCNFVRISDVVRTRYFRIYK